MDRKAVMEILDGYKTGAVSQAEAIEKLTFVPFEDTKTLHVVMSIR